MSGVAPPNTNTPGILSKTKGMITKNAEPTMEWILKKMAGMSSKEVLTAAKQNELTTCAWNYLWAFIALIVVAVTGYIASTDDKALTDSFFTYMICMVLPILVAVYLALPIFKSKVSGGVLTVNIFIFVIMVLAITLFYKNKDPASMEIVKYAIYVGAFFSVIIGLALAYKLFGRFAYNSRGWYGVILQIILFLPCLLLDFIEYVKQELRVAPSTVYVLIAIECILLLVLYVLPKLMKPRYSKSTTTILKEPVFLNERQQIADYKVLALDDVVANPFLQEVRFRTNYSISFWAYLNPKGTVSMPILRLGDQSDPGGKPVVSYANGKYTFQFTNQKSSNQKSSNNESIPSHEVVLPSQKWNFFVITYNDHTVDLFVNGNLEKTYDIELPTYGPGDVIEVGYTPSRAASDMMGIDYSASSATDSLSGAICNVNYYKTPMTQRQIVTEYNLLMFKNPPTNE